LPGTFTEDAVLVSRLIQQKVPESVDTGATAVREEWYGDDLDHVVMLDPEGNDLCVA
jgi:hypothetical protein